MRWGGKEIHTIKLHQHRNVSYVWLTTITTYRLRTTMCLPTHPTTNPSKANPCTFPHLPKHSCTPLQLHTSYPTSPPLCISLHSHPTPKIIPSSPLKCTHPTSPLCCTHIYRGRKGHKNLFYFMYRFTNSWPQLSHRGSAVGKPKITTVQIFPVA